MTHTTPESAAPLEGDEERKARQAADEARIAVAWKSGRYKTKERCLEALGLEKLNNAALWKRIKRIIDRGDRQASKSSAD